MKPLWTVNIGTPRSRFILITSAAQGSRKRPSPKKLNFAESPREQIKDLILHPCSEEASLQNRIEENAPVRRLKSFGDQSSNLSVLISAPLLREEGVICLY